MKHPLILHMSDDLWDGLTEDDKREIFRGPW
jgi:TRAP-type C4-dicarboxylate transport system substrate-binding protein